LTDFYPAFDPRRARALVKLLFVTPNLYFHITVNNNERLVRAERLKAEGAELDHLAELERLVDREELERRGAELERLERAERLDRLPASARTTTPGIPRRWPPAMAGARARGEG
jgi:hypothetical protein